MVKLHLSMRDRLRYALKKIATQCKKERFLKPKAALNAVATVLHEIEEKLMNKHPLTDSDVRLQLQILNEKNYEQIGAMPNTAINEVEISLYRLEKELYTNTNIQVAAWKRIKHDPRKTLDFRSFYF